MKNSDYQEEQKLKQAIFDKMPLKRQQYILNKVGFDKWNPFQEPKDPIDMRKDKTKRTTQMLVREFLQTKEIEKYSNAYGSGVLEICLGVLNSDDKYLGMFDFSCWYYELLKREGHIN